MSQQPCSALILGGRGLVGQALTKELTTAGWDVNTLEHEDVSLACPEELTQRVHELNPDALFNTMAWTQVDKAEEHPDEALAINRGLPALLGRIVKNSSIHLVHYSTDFVFNGRKKTPYTVDDAADPQSVYGQTKWAGEQALMEIDLPNCTIVRTAWLFGPGRTNFVSTILGLAQERDTLTVVHDQIGSPTYTPDLAKASLQLAKMRASGVFHVVNSGQASWCELAAEAVRLASLPATVHAITTDAWPTLAPRPAYSVLDTSLYMAVTGRSMRPWIQALQEYVFTDFLLAQPNAENRGRC